MSWKFNRREFITLFGGAAAAAVSLPLHAQAQQSAMPVVGFLRRTAGVDAEPFVKAFRQGLAEAGFVEAQTVAVEYRWAEGQTSRLPSLAGDLVRRQVSVIIAGGNEALAAAKAATSTIPIVFAIGDDPVKTGFVASLNRPGGNITGISFTNTDLVTKQLELLRELIPRNATIALFKNPNSTSAEGRVRELQAAARSLGQQVLVLDISSEHEFAPAFANLVQKHVGAIIVGGSALFTNRREITTLAARHGIPAIYDTREQVMAGGLMSYGAIVAEAYRQAGNYAGRILKGAKPADLPVMQPTKFELVINLKAAKALGLRIPQTILVQADEVIR